MALWCIPMDILAWTECVRSSAGKISYIDIFSSSNLQKILIFPYLLQHISDKIIQNPLQTVRHFSELMKLNYTMWSKSSQILLQPISKLKVYVKYLLCICKHILYGPLIGFNKIFITKLENFKPCKWDF